MGIDAGNHAYFYAAPMWTNNRICLKRQMHRQVNPVIRNKAHDHFNNARVLVKLASSSFCRLTTKWFYNINEQEYDYNKVMRGENFVHGESFSGKINNICKQ